MRSAATGSPFPPRSALVAALERAAAGTSPTREEAVALLGDASCTDLLLDVAGGVRDAYWGSTFTYSPRVSLPVTNLCRDRCTYCTFRKDPDDPDAWTMLPDDIAAWSRRGRAMGCIEALMCLGDKPELAFRGYRTTLAELGHRTTAEYVERACRIALDWRLAPHNHAGILSHDEMARVRAEDVSAGLTVEH